MKFEETSYRAIRVAQRRKWTLIGTIGAILALFIFLLVNYQIKQSKTNALTAEYMAAEDVYSQEMQAFQLEFQKAPEDLKLDYLKKKPSHEKSAQLYKALFNKSPHHTVGYQAGIRFATIALDAEQWEEAITTLEALKSKLVSHSVAQSQVRRALAGAYAQLKNFDKALEEMTFLEKLPRNPLLAQHRLFKSELLYLSGKKDLAKSSLKEISETPNYDAQIREQAKLWLSYWEL